MGPPVSPKITKSSNKEIFWLVRVLYSIGIGEWVKPPSLVGEEKIFLSPDPGVIAYLR